MGHYTAISLSLTFKPDTPTEVIHLMHQLIGESSITDPTPVSSDLPVPSSPEVRHILEYMPSALSVSWSAYLATWGRRTWAQDEHGRWVFHNKISLKSTNREAVKDFLISMLPYLEVEEGTVLYRDLYESGLTEQIFYHTEGKIVQADGYWYYDPIDDDEHPYADVDVDWDPPMVYDQLMQAVKAKRAERDADRQLSWYGHQL